MTKNSDFDKLEAVLSPDMGDRVAFYSDEEVMTWLKQFIAESSKMFIKDCPFSYGEIRREYLRRELCKED